MVFTCIVDIECVKIAVTRSADAFYLVLEPEYVVIDRFVFFC